MGWIWAVKQLRNLRQLWFGRKTVQLPFSEVGKSGGAAGSGGKKRVEFWKVQCETPVGMK